MMTFKPNGSVISKPCVQLDLLRVTCGITEFFLIDEFDLHALRHLQSSYWSPARLFKPVPEGFEIDFGRKVLLAGN